MVDTITFNADEATVTITIGVPRTGVMPPSDPDYVQRYPACEAVRLLMPDIVREMAAGYLEPSAGAVSQ